MFYDHGGSATPGATGAGHFSAALSCSSKSSCLTESLRLTLCLLVLFLDITRFFYNECLGVKLKVWANNGCSVALNFTHDANMQRAENWVCVVSRQQQLCASLVKFMWVITLNRQRYVLSVSFAWAPGHAASYFTTPGWVITLQRPRHTSPEPFWQHYKEMQAIVKGGGVCLSFTGHAGIWYSVMCNSPRGELQCYHKSVLFL